MDAQLSENVLGEEDFRVDSRCEDGGEVLHLFERSVFFGWAGPEWLRGDCVGGAGEVRPGLAGASGVRKDPVYVRREHGAEVQFQAVYKTDGRLAGRGDIAVPGLMGGTPLDPGRNVGPPLVSGE